MPKPKCPNRMPMKSTIVMPSDTPNTLIFPNAMPAAITVASNRMECPTPFP